MFVIMIDDGLLAYLEEYVTENRKKLFHRILSERTRHFTVVLEDIYQSHNASAVVRSCDIFGIQDIHTIENKYTSKVSRHVAKGSQKWLDFNRYDKDMDNTLDCLKNLKKKGYRIIGTTPHDGACLLPDFDVTQKSAFVFGVEKEGISEIVKEQADGFLKIPMVGFTESLNISVAAAIILQDVTTRVKRMEVPWQLTAEEKQNIYADWIQKSIKNVEKLTDYYYKKIV